MIGLLARIAGELAMGVELLTFATIILCVAALFGIGCLALAARVLERAARANAITQAQSDEHAKVFMCFAEKSMSRLMAATLPRAHQVFRATAGGSPTTPPDGMQHKVVPHFNSPFPEVQQQVEEVKRRLAAEAAMNMARMRAEALPLQELPVGTQADFELNPERANGAAGP